MIKLNAGVSRKVGEANYGSRGVSVNVELELESAVVNDVGQLHERIKKLFAVARAAVDEELGISGQVAAAGATNHAASGATQKPVNGNGARPATNGAPPASRPATDTQVRAIKALAGRLGLDAEKEVASRFGHPLAQLTLPDASTLIDEWKSASGK